MTSPGPGEPSPQELARQVRAEQRQRWRQGERPLVEEFVRRHPPLGAEREAVLELVYNEVVLREERGEGPRLEEYLERFPGLAAELRLQFEVHAAMQAQAAADPAGPSADAPTFRGPGVAPPRPAPPAVPGYELLRELGRGGMGVVYLARQLRLRRPVALKMILAGRHAGPDAVARFLREAEAVAAVQHPNIVQIYEVGEADGLPFLALEYVAGGSLDARLAGKPLAPRAAAHLVRTLARAMHAAHQAGVVHRDLKPANVLLSDAGAGAAGDPSGWGSQAGLAAATLKITDFGLAKLLVADAQGLTRSNELLGTPSYMAPEQTTGKGAVGLAVDVYALGAILYHLLTGRPPFLADTPWATLLQVQHEEPVSPSRLHSRTPRDLVTVCLKCLQKEPAKRYASALDLADDLGRFLDGKPIRARPVGALERAAKWARRRPAVAASLAGMVLTAALGLAGVLGQWLATRQALAQAETNLYFNHVTLAHREWLDFNVGRADELLASRRPPPGPPWEWGYLRRLCQTELLRLGGHEDSVRAVAFSPDGKLLATATGSWSFRDPAGVRGFHVPGNVRLWDAASGALRWTGPDHRGSVMSVAFSPDGRHLASASWDATVRLWDVRTGRVEQTLAGHTRGVHAVAYSPDGRLLASGGFDATVRLWDAATGRQIRVRSTPVRSLASCLAFSPDGRQLAAGNLSGSVQVWELAEGKDGPDLYERPSLTAPDQVYGVAFSPDGRQVAAACLNHTVRVWDRANSERFLDYHGHSSPVQGVAFHPDGRVLASCDNYGTIRLWEARGGAPAGTVRGHSGHVFGLAFSRDGRRLASASNDRTAKVWDLTADQESQTLGQSDGGLNSGVQSLAFSPDSRWLAISDERMRSHPTAVFFVTDPESGEGGPVKGHEGWVSCVAFDPRGRLVASGSADHTVRLWEVGTWKPRHRLEGHGAAVTHVAFGPDGRRLASSGEDRTVRVWDTDTGRELLRLEGHESPVLAAAFAGGGRHVVAVGEDGTVTAWDAAGGRLAGRLDRHVGPVTRVAFGGDGRLLACWGPTNDLRVWDVSGAARGKVTALARGPLRGHKDAVNGLAFSADGGRLASASEDGSVKLWDVATGHEALGLVADPDRLTAVAFSADGRYLATAGWAIKLWDASLPGPAERAAAAARRAPAWHQTQIGLSGQKREWWAAGFHLDQLPAAEPDAGKWSVEPGPIRAELGQWDRALAEFAGRVEKQPDQVEAWYRLAVAQLGAGRHDAYRATCAEMARRFPAGGGATRVLYACVPDPGAAEPAALTALAGRAGLDAGYERLRGAVRYRTGRFAEAVDSFREAAAKGNRERAWDWLFLAMAHHRRGDGGKAREYLARAAAWIDEAERREQPGEGQRLWFGWYERVEVQALRREAEELLRQP